MEAPGISDRAWYVFDASVEVLRKKHQSQNSTRWERSSTNFIVHPKKNAPIYEKASANSLITREIPDNLAEINVEHGSPALDGDGFFWRVSAFHEDEYISGYLNQDDTEKE